MARSQYIVDVHIIFENKQSEVLIIRRANTGYKDGQYSLVAGHLEDGETLEDCAIRESYEEAGVNVSLTNLAMIHLMRRDAGEQKRISVFFKARDWSGELRNMEPQKCDEFRWVKIGDLPTNTVDYIQFAMSKILENTNVSDYTPIN